jgi:hypothetical protein
MTTVTGGFKSTEIESRTKVEPDTHQYAGQFRQGLDVIAQSFYYQFITGAVSSATSTTMTLSSDIGIVKGDIIHFTSGAAIHTYAFVQSVSTVTVTFSQRLEPIPAAADTFEVMRPIFGRASSDGSAQTTHNTTVISDGAKTVTTAGTRVKLSTDQVCNWVIITGNESNSGVVVVGGDTVVAAVGSRQGTPLLPFQSVTLLCSNLNEVSVDAVVSTDGVTFTFGM